MAALRFEAEQLRMLNELLGLRLDELLDRLGVAYWSNRCEFYGACPVHGGDNPTAWKVYREGHTQQVWRCYSRHCEKVFQQTLLGLVRGVLSRQGCGYDGDECRSVVPFTEAVHWCCEFLGQPLESLRVDPVLVDKQRFSAAVARLNTAGREQ